MKDHHAPTVSNGRVAIDVYSFCVECGIDISEQFLPYPLTGLSMCKKHSYSIVLHNRLSEAEKRVVMTSILAICLDEKRKVDTLITEFRSEKNKRMTRRLLMPAKTFRIEYARWKKLGGLRPSFLAIRFGVPLVDVMSRMMDLGLI